MDAIYRMPSEIDVSLSETAGTQFSIMHANCRGFLHNFDKLLSFVNTSAIDLSVIAVSET